MSSVTEPRQYDPEYVSIEAIPIEVPDEYSVPEKREALFQAEGELEIDRNGGQFIEPEDFTQIHYQAILNLATHYLVRGATGNSDITLGDLDDGGEQTERHADQYYETYRRLLDRLAEVGSDGQSGTWFGARGGDDAGSIAVNAGDGERRHRFIQRRNLLRDAVHDDYVDDTN